MCALCRACGKKRKKVGPVLDCLLGFSNQVGKRSCGILVLQLSEEWHTGDVFKKLLVVGVKETGNAAVDVFFKPVLSAAIMNGVLPLELDIKSS